ncbi:hypothetical protein BZA77DRAFT_325165 [Pyronema omphalodes]|nr:hypothetical protein BZA77DRAFT_325165 [Pyronema omphalodes]
MSEGVLLVVFFFFAFFSCFFLLLPSATTFCFLLSFPCKGNLGWALVWCFTNFFVFFFTGKVGNRMGRRKCRVGCGSVGNCFVW